MAPPRAPPPYTPEQIQALSTPEERFRANAELRSYIASFKKDSEEQEAPQPDDSPRSLSGPHRNNHYRGRARGSGYYSRGRGYSYHASQPYPQPQYASRKFPNKTVTFNNITPSVESPKEIHTPSKEDTGTSIDTRTLQSFTKVNANTLCPAFTSTGRCSRPGCPQIHDSNKQALCKKWLYKDDCLKGGLCTLSHKPVSENAPMCLHFQDGLCNNDECRFAHIRVNPLAPVCKAFGRLGYCEKGDHCTDLHVHECPDFSNKGSCSRGDTCRLRHVRNASRMKAAARRSSEEASSPSANGEAEETSKVKRELQDEIVDNTNGASADPHALSQQADFIPFDG